MDYKEILKGIVNIINTTENSDIGFLNICTYIGENCPELKESDDERIKKWLIGYFNQYIIDGMPQVFGNGLNAKDVIAWLEKQKDTSSIERVFRPDAGCTITNAATQAIEQQKLGYKIVLAFNGAYIPVEGKTVNDIVNEYYSLEFEKKYKN